MKYFLIIGLMIVGSFAQADICSSSWWSSATTSQVETEAELKGPLAMNVPCEDGSMPIDLALHNGRRDPLILAAILENFELDEETQHRVVTLIADIQRVTLRLLDIPDEYPEDSDFSIRILDNFDPNTEDDSEREILRFLSIPDEYPQDSGDSDRIPVQLIEDSNPIINGRRRDDIEVQPIMDNDANIRILDNFDPNTKNDSVRAILRLLGIIDEYPKDSGDSDR